MYVKIQISILQVYPKNILQSSCQRRPNGANEAGLSYVSYVLCISPRNKSVNQNQKQNIHYLILMINVLFDCAGLLAGITQSTMITKN